MSAERFAEAAGAGIDGPPQTPLPVPEELSTSFLEAVWHNMPWTTTSWMGQEISSTPTDLFAYQELLSRTRVDWVIETCPQAGGRSLFLANTCEALGHGNVISVGATPAPDGLAHPRLRHVTGSIADRKTAAELRSTIGDGTVMAILAGRLDRPGTVAEFETVAPHVPVGAYVVVADTVVNGNPVWTGFGPGPAEAVKNILRRHGEFVQDNTVQTFSLSFDPGGYLRRVAD